jgi:integrase
MSPQATRFTTTHLQSLRPGPKQRDITDPGTRGLVLRIEPNGTKSWLFRYKWAGEAVRLALGFFPTTPLHEARRIALERHDLLRRRIDPRKAARPKRGPVSAGAHRRSIVPSTSAIAQAAAADTIADRKALEEVLDAEVIALDPHSFEFLAREFYRLYIIPNRAKPSYIRRILVVDVLPVWRGRDARTIRAREIVEFLDTIVDRGSRVMANRIAAILGQLFMFGIQRDIVTDSPVKLLFRPGGKERPRTRRFSEEELQAFIQGIHKACRSRLKAHVLMFLLLTLQRRGEVGLAEWREFNFTQRTWHIPDEHSRKYRGHVLPLCDWALEELEIIRRITHNRRFLLPSTGHSNQPADPKLITRSVAKSLKRFAKLGIAPFTPHDLRRTGRTMLSRLGIPRDIKERVINHSMSTVEGTYDLWEYVDEKRAALEKWERYLKELRDSPPLTKDPTHRQSLSSPSRRANRASVGPS